MDSLLPLARKVGEKLKARKETVGVSESSSGGLISAVLLAVPGASAYFMGGAVVYWFAGASRQAVTTGAYRAVDYIKRNIKLSTTEKASAKDSNEVVRICTCSTF